MKAGGWERKQGTELEGRTLGVIGTGRIGRLVTRFALALDMKVVGYDAYPDPGYAPSRLPLRAAGWTCLRGADIVTLHCPHTPGERPLIDAAGPGPDEEGCAAGQHRPGGACG